MAAGCHLILKIDGSTDVYPNRHEAEKAAKAHSSIANEIVDIFMLVARVSPPTECEVKELVNTDGL